MSVIVDPKNAEIQKEKIALKKLLICSTTIGLMFAFLSILCMLKTCDSANGAGVVSYAIENLLSEDSLATPDEECAMKETIQISDEMLDINQLKPSNVQVSEDEKIIGFELSYKLDEAYSKVISSMVSKGWVYFESGSKNAATFKKSGGQFSWSMATFTEVDNVVAVVLMFD